MQDDEAIELNDIPEEKWRIVAEPIILRIMELQGLRYFKHEIKIQLEEELSTPGHPVKIDYIVFEKLILGARAARAELIKRPFADVKADAISFYEAVIRCDDTHFKDKIRAQERLDLLLGLEREGQSLDTPEDKAARVREALKEALGYDTDDGIDGQVDASQTASGTASSVEQH